MTAVFTIDFAEGELDGWVGITGELGGVCVMGTLIVGEMEEVGAFASSKLDRIEVVGADEICMVVVGRVGCDIELCLCPLMLCWKLLCGGEGMWREGEGGGGSMIDASERHFLESFLSNFFSAPRELVAFVMIGVDT